MSVRSEEVVEETRNELELIGFDESESRYYADQEYQERVDERRKRISRGFGATALPRQLQPIHTPEEQEWIEQEVERELREECGYTDEDIDLVTGDEFDEPLFLKLGLFVFLAPLLGTRE